MPYAIDVNDSCLAHQGFVCWITQTHARDPRIYLQGGADMAQHEPFR